MHKNTHVLIPWGNMLHSTADAMQMYQCWGQKYPVGGPWWNGVSLLCAYPQISPWILWNVLLYLTKYTP